MKLIAKKTAQVIFPILFGFFLIWWVVKDLTSLEIEEAKNAFQQADYFYLSLSMLIGYVSHIVRAVRWELMIAPMGYSTRFSTRYHAVLINYLMNLFVPRMGEVARCTTLARYEKIPFNKAFGTLILERIIDFLILFLMIATVIYFERDKVWLMVKSNLITKIPTNQWIWILAILFILGLFVALYIIKHSEIGIIKKLKEFLLGVKEGVTTILHLKNHWIFWFQSFLIWGLYLLGTYVCFMALPQTQNIPLTGVVSCFVLAGIVSITTQGGLGAYPIAFGIILKKYGISYVLGWTFGWISWLAQTLVILVFGIISIFLLSYMKKNNTESNI